MGLPVRDAEEPTEAAVTDFRFGRFELDSRTRELRKDGVRLRLQEQPFAVLAMMLAHPGELLTRDELRDELWPEGTFVDFEHGLNAAIKRLRSVLGDDAERPRFVETLHRRGYRFIARVERRTRRRIARAAAANVKQQLAVLPFTHAGDAST
jgi:DNA-binding winged helix-turn-helix (wHTH) protein